jgi:tRNA(Ile)-lysidine synthase
MKEIDVIRIVERTLGCHDMLSVGHDVPVILMVSGGSDSVAMARILPQLLPRRRFTILHINHQLRGKEADEDERFVVELARELGLPCEVRRFDVATLAANSGDNVEQAGRAVRYAAANELLDELCLKADVDPAFGRIATAHTLDDRAETFFMRTIVGAGMGALSSIPYRNERVIRPLLDCSRQQLRDWREQQGATQQGTSRQGATRQGTTQQDTSHLGEKQQDTVPAGSPAGFHWREDATNSDTSHSRAFVRHELIPLMQARNPELLQTVAGTLDNLACDDRLLSKMMDELEQRLVIHDDNPQNGIVKIDGALFHEDRALVRRLIRRVCSRVAPKDKRITHEHIVSIAEQGNRVGFVTVIPGAITVTNEYGTLVISRKEEPESAAKIEPSWCASLREDHPVILPDGRVVELIRIAPDSFQKDPVAFAQRNARDTQVFVDGDRVFRIGGELKLSRVRPGDRFCPLGMSGRHRLVSDVLIDRKIPRRLRSALCRVYVECVKENGPRDEIVWIIGVQLDDRFKVSETTRSMLSIIVGESKDS